MRYYYHGTSKSRLKKILRLGLLPGCELKKHGIQANWGGITHNQPWVHVSTTIVGAQDYCAMNGFPESQWIILKIKPVGKILEPPTYPLHNPGDKVHEGRIPPENIEVWQRDFIIVKGQLIHN